MSDEAAESSRRAHAGWQAARAIGEEPHLEWTFAWHRFRAFLLRAGANDLGAMYFYEPVPGLDQLITIGLLREKLSRLHAPEETTLEIEVGFDVFDSTYRAPGGRLQLPAREDPWRGRHHVVISGFEDHGETIVFRNSWGRRWGNAGIGYMGRDFFERYAHHSSVSSFAHVGVKPESFEPGGTSVSDAEWLAEYLRLRGRSVEVRDIRGNPHEFVSYRVASMGWNCPVDVVEIWAAGRRWAWAHLYHPSGLEDRRSVIRELFVENSARRRGIASALVDRAMEIAAKEGSRRLLLEVQEADGHATGLSRAEAFAATLGFRAEPVGPEKRPVVVLRASKSF